MPPKHNVLERIDNCAHKFIHDSGSKVCVRCGLELADCTSLPAPRPPFRCEWSREQARLESSVEVIVREKNVVKILRKINSTSDARARYAAKVELLTRCARDHKKMSHLVKVYEREERKAVTNSRTRYEAAVSRINELCAGLGEDVRERAVCALKELVKLHIAQGDLALLAVCFALRELLRGRDVKKLAEMCGSTVDELIKLVSSFDNAAAVDISIQCTFDVSRETLDNIY